jgi:hypothetical protein
MNVFLAAFGLPLLERIAFLLDQHGVRTSIATNDEDALRMLGIGGVDVVAVGGGVEHLTRARIVEAAQDGRLCSSEWQRA